MAMDEVYDGLLGILEGINWQLPATELAPGIWLRAPSEEDLRVLREHRERHPALRTLTEHSCLLQSRGAISGSPTIDKPQDAVIETVNHRLEQPLLLLRLFREGPIGLRWAALTPRQDTHQQALALPLGHLPLVRHHGAPEFYRINQEDVPPLREWFRKRWADPLLNRPGVRWFMRSYTEAYDEHRALHLIFGLEQILLYREEDRSSIGYKFALRGSWALGSNASERRSLIAELKKLYRLRSEVVHGKNTSELEADEARIIWRAESHLRCLLRRTLMKGSEVTQGSQWDEAIIAGNASLEGAG